VILLLTEILRVPEPVLFTAKLFPLDDALRITFETIEALLGAEIAQVIIAATPAELYKSAVKVTPALKLKEPPFVAPPVVSLRTSATVVLTFTVIANEFDINTSALVNVGNKLLAVPVGVVDQTSAALMLPALRA
jgi:hypothetical protein